jgi:hypothetical protein
MANFNKDVGVDFDNLSVTEIDSVIDHGDSNLTAIIPHNNKETLKRIFGTYDDFSAYDNEEKLISSIRDSDKVKWDEISEIHDLPEFIKEAFKTKLNWTILLFNRFPTTKLVVIDNNKSNEENAEFITAMLKR